MIGALLQQHTYTGMTADSRQVQPGNLFIAYPGEHQDGRQYIEQAIQKGARAVIYETQGFSQTIESQDAVALIGIPDLRAQVSALAAEFYQNPSHQLWVIGVTGTNGKTSCSYWLAQCFAALQRPCALIGTLGHGLLTAENRSALTMSMTGNTTPDAILLQAYLADYVAQGAEVVSMEVSSHGLVQQRVSAVEFDVAIFTNLSRDHLDFHGSMQAYAAAKRQLFEMPSVRCSIINIDDEYGREIAKCLRQDGKPVLTYGIAKAQATSTAEWVADIRVVDYTLSAQGMYMQVLTPNGEVELRAPIVGEFNVYNLLAVFATLLISGVDRLQAAALISQLQPVAGRMQQLGGMDKPMVVVDYAHTPDALQQVLQTLRVQCHGQLICVFGCGGNRDSGKRSEMGAVANALADWVVITDDNPRDEDALSIRQQIASAVQPEKCHMLASRAQAIETAIQRARPQDIVLVAGKGHENHQEIAGVKHPFNDSQVVAEALARWAA